MELHDLTPEQLMKLKAKLLYQIKLIDKTIREKQHESNQKRYR
jgi:hypothetical protein